MYVLYIYCVRLKVFAYTQYTHCIHRFIGGFEGFILSTSSFSSMLAGNLFAWKLRHSTSIARVTLRKRLLAAKKHVTHLTRDTFQSTSSELTNLKDNFLRQKKRLPKKCIISGHRFSVVVKASRKSEMKVPCCGFILTKTEVKLEIDLQWNL